MININYFDNHKNLNPNGRMIHKSQTKEKKQGHKGKG